MAENEDRQTIADNIKGTNSTGMDGAYEHTEQEEIREWMDVNRKLRRHGLSSIRALASNQVDATSGRYVCIDLESSQSLRTSVISLITEVNRKENMMQDLLSSNTELKDEVNVLTEEVESLNAKAKDIKVMLECSRARVQELEADQSRSMEDGERLKNTKWSMNQKCRLLEAKVEEQDKELTRLRKELLTMAEENDRRSKRQNEVFSGFRKRTPKTHSGMDQSLLDIIDSYESQIHSLKKQLEASRSGSAASRQEVVSSHLPEHSKNFKAILKSYEKQVRDKDRQIQSLEEERNIRKTDLGLRPEPKDYRLQTQRVKKLEQLLALHNINIPGEKSVKDPFLSRRKFSTRLEDLDYLPLEQCHRYLRELCDQLETDNLDCLTDVIQQLKDAEDSDRFVEYCRDLSEIVESLDERTRNRLYRAERNPDMVLCDSNMRYYLEVVENWRKDISCLGELQDALNDLLEKLVPWMHARMEGDHTVPEIIELVERVTHAEKKETSRTLAENVSRAQLEGVVSHFQTLFDVPKVSGVFPRMNEIYRSLGELKNVHKSLKGQLGLPEDTHSSALVDAVGHLCHMYNSTTTKQLKSLLQSDDLNSVVRMLNEHKEFFPAFRGVMHKLFDILGVDAMDEVIPAVRALKLLAK